MNWKEFKELVEKAGVKDEDKLLSIEVLHFDRFDVKKTDDGWVIQSSW